jgi:CubicO group peptidase (beta-lactamase class C family)
MEKAAGTSVIRSFLRCERRGRLLAFAIGTLVATIGIGCAGEPAPRASSGLVPAPMPPAHVVDVRSGEVAEGIDAVLRDASTGGFGGSILIEIDDEVVLKAGYGWANREMRIPFTARTIAQIGSLTKQFTATAILSLAAEGRLALGATVGEYFPTAAEPGASLTLYQLLTHTAGMPQYCGHDFDRYTRNDLLTRCLAGPLVHAPGSAYLYSNPGFSVLAAVVEQVGGEGYESFLDRRFFAPIGMTRTAYFYPELPRRDFAVGYIEDEPTGVISDQLAPLAPDFWNLKGNGGMQSTVEDMYRWYRVLRGVDPDHPDVLGPEVRRQLLTPHYSRKDEEGAVGYGWRFEPDENGAPAVMTHGGSDGVFLAYFIWRPLDGTFFYIVGNNGTDAIIPVLKRARKILNDATTGQPGK